MGAICGTCKSVQPEKHFRETNHTKVFATDLSAALRVVNETLRAERERQDGYIEELEGENTLLKSLLEAAITEIEEVRRTAKNELDEVQEKLRKAYVKIRSIEGW